MSVRDIHPSARLGANVKILGDLSLAEGAVIGRMTTLMHDVSIGERTRITDNIHITGNARIEADVFIGPGVSTANDNDVYLRRFGLLPFETNGPTIRRFAVIGTGAILTPGIEIGMGAFGSDWRDGDQGCAALDDCRRRARPRNQQD